MFNLLTDVVKKPEKLQPKQQLILRHLMDTGRPVTIEELFKVLWGEPEDGGPLAFNKNIQVHISRIRRQLRPGFQIIPNWKGQYQFVVSRKTIVDRIAKAISLSRS